MTLGPFVGGVLTDKVSWRSLLAHRGPGMAGDGSGGVHSRARHRSRGKPDWNGLVTVTVSLAVLSVVVDLSSYWSWPATTIGLTVGITAAALLVRHERTTSNPLIDIGVLRNRHYLTLTLTGAVSNAVTVIFLFVVPLTLQHNWALSATEAGAAFLAPAIAMAIASPLAGRVPPSIAVPTMLACLVIASISTGCLVQISGLAAYLITATITGAVLGVANSLTRTTTQTVIDPEYAGQAAGLTKTVITISAGLCIGGFMPA